MTRASENKVDISVVVGTYNRADMLRQTLESLTRLETEGRFAYEIVAVNNASTDHTDEVIAQTSPGAASACLGFNEPQAGVAFARNRGIREARGEWVAFQDDDQVADPRWLIELWELAHRRDVRCVGGDVKLRLPEGCTRRLSPQCVGVLGGKVGMTEEQPFNRKQIPGTNNLMIHRSVLEDVGLFNVLLTDGGEDADLARRIRAAGYEAWYTPASVVYHLIPEKRLEDEYMRWTSLRKGQHVARRERLDWGQTMLPLVMLARLGQALGNYLPRYVAHRLRGDREGSLGARCLLWRSEGYLRQAVELLSGKSAEVAGGDVSLNLREGREKLVAPAKPNTTAEVAVCD